MENKPYLPSIIRAPKKARKMLIDLSRYALGVTAVILSITCSIVSAQTLTLPGHIDMRWRLVGPFRAGRALAATGIPGNCRVFYFGAVDGGVWKSTNAGLTWESMSNGLLNPSIGALAVAPSDPEILYAGTGEADMRSDITYGDGVYKSTDGGRKWTHVGLDDTRHIGKILIDPHNPDVVLVAALGRAYGPNSERGVFRTTDGGRTWEKVLYKNPDVGAIDLSWDPNDPAIVYAAMWQARRTPWSQYPPDEGNGSGLYKSTDNGKSWAEVSLNGLPRKPYGRIGVSVATGSRGQVVYALVQALKEGSGLYRSDNGGQTWTLTSSDPRIVTRMWYFGRVFVDPTNENIVYVPNRSVMRSTDGGKTFVAIKGSPGGDDYHFLWIDPKNDHRMIVASDQGTTLSLDNGKTWSSWYNQPTGQFYHVATDNEFPYRIYGAQQDAGTVSIASRSDYGEITFRDWYSVGAGESGYIAPDPLNPNIVYGGDTYGGIFRFDRRTGQSQVISPSLLASFYTPTPQRKYRFTWTSPIVFDLHDPRTLYFGAQVLLMTRDGGLHWQTISPDLTLSKKQFKDRQNLNGVETSHKGWGVIYTIAPSPIRAGLIWIGTDNGLIQLTKDGGRHWENVTPPGITPWSKISMIEASPFIPGEAYAAVDRHRLNDLSPYIYRTRDFGRHWTRIDDGIGPESFVRVVRCDLKKKGLLFAGTETGVYVSFDDGDHWQSLQFNLPTASVRDLAVHGHDLVAATHGRAFWVLDDLTPLEQFDRSVLNSNVHLFQPEQAIRIRRSVNSDTPLPPEIPHGTNPPAGAIIDYYLGTSPQGPVTLQVFDRYGNLVRQFSSDYRPKPDKNPPYFMNAWLPIFKGLPTHIGMNRFVWNLRYFHPPISDHGYSMAVANLHSVRDPEGPLVLPGEYKIVLAVDGKSYSRFLRVKMDPRVHVAKTALRDQLALAIGIWNAIAEENSLIGQVDTLDAQISGLKEGDKLNSDAVSDVRSLAGKLKAYKETLNVGELSGLESDVMSADREPTSQMMEAFRILASRLSDARNKLETIKMKELPSLNRQLEKSGLQAIRPAVIPPLHLKLPFRQNTGVGR
ncbi:MAG: hypothetical protein M1469_09190 [Bacteroidetes bacterium]|nr:hypothetical protein [Bacteroidota bacterium]